MGYWKSQMNSYIAISFENFQLEKEFFKNMLHQSFQPYLSQIIPLLQKHKIRSAYVFGSVLTDRFNEESDVDFLVNIEEGQDPVEAGGHLWDLYDDLRKLLNREVDLLTERSLKNPYFIQEVNQTKFSIYG